MHLLAALVAENVDSAHSGNYDKVFKFFRASAMRCCVIECVGSTHDDSGTGLYFTRRRVEGDNNSALKSPINR